MIARNNDSGVKFREEKFLWRSGSLNSRNFIPDHLTPLRKINSPGIYFPGFLRNEYSWTFLVQEYLFLALSGICVPEENIFLTSVIIINNLPRAPTGREACFRYTILSVCLSVCLSVFPHKWKAGNSFVFPNIWKAWIRGNSTSGYPQVFRISQIITISPKKIYTPRFFDFWNCLWKCGFLHRKKFDFWIFFENVEFFQKKIRFLSFFSRLWIFLQKLETPIFFLIL